jgi:uncharacterized damage-inducible protein DinB
LGNTKITDVALKLPESDLKTENKSSFSSIYATFLHLWDAESIWWQRMKLLEQIQVPSLSFKPSMTEVADGLLNQSSQWHEWITNSPDHVMTHVFEYRNSKKELFKQPVWEVLMHIFNHGTYHRGQIVTLLRNVGVTIYLLQILLSI